MEELSTIFAENKLKFDEQDERLDANEDVSSSDELVYNPNYLRDYSIEFSRASCNIDDIQFIIYGGFSSRFWLYRKYMNSIDTHQLRDNENIPFYSWECITLQLKHR